MTDINSVSLQLGKPECRIYSFRYVIYEFGTNYGNSKRLLKQFLIVHNRMVRDQSNISYVSFNEVIGIAQSYFGKVVLKFVGEIIFNTVSFQYMLLGIYISQERSSPSNVGSGSSFQIT